MSEIRVASIHEIDDDRGLLVEPQGRRLAIFRYQGEYYALDDRCPHRDGSLHEGPIDEGVVTCPRHHWQFDIRTGVCPVNPLSKVKVYRTRLKGKDLFVELD